jgi:hypothetical protein
MNKKDEKLLLESVARLYRILLCKLLVKAYSTLHITEGSKSNIPCCALLAWQVRATFASDSQK